MEDEKRDTVGKISTDLLKQEPQSRDPIELQREMQQDYEKNIVGCIDSGKKQHAGNFYIVVITKKERLLENVLRNYFFTRESCPTPEWDQAVFSYNRKMDSIDFLWVIPSKDTCELFYRHAMEIVPEERVLLGYVLSFYDGSLLRLSKKLNGEADDSPLLVH